MDKKKFDEFCKHLRDQKGDLRPTDVNSFPEPILSTLNMALRVGRVSLTQLSKYLEITPEQARQLADLLVKRNLFQLSPYSNSDEVFYETRMSASTRPLIRPGMGVWKKTDDNQ